MSLYAVKLASLGSGPKFNGHDAMVVQANTTAEAKNLAKAASSAVDGSQGVDAARWAAATVLDLAATAALDLTGWVFTCGVTTSIATLVSYTAVAGDDLDAVGTALAALIASQGTGTTGAAYNTSTNLLTVASAGNTLGDKTVTMTVTPPSGRLPTGVTVTTPFGTITHQGSSGAALTVQLSTTWVIPGAILQYRQ